MSRPALVLLIAGGLFLAGCAQDSTDVSEPGAADSGSAAAPTVEPTAAFDDPFAETTEASGSAGDAKAVQPERESAQPEPQPPGPLSLPEAAPSLTPVPIESGVVAIGPENAEIQFVGRHADPQKDDRVGVFQEFSGRIVVDPEAQALKAITVEIQTESLVTPIDRLTNHLKSPDFFEVREYPTARFQSTQITSESADPSQHRVVGELTLRGVTKQINLPAAAELVDDGLTLVSEFIIKRSDFRMNWGPDQVENEVMMTVRVGRKTEVPAAEGR